MNTLEKIKDYFAKEGFTETQRTDLGGDYIYFIDKTNHAGFDEILVSHTRAGNENTSFILGSETKNFDDLAITVEGLKSKFDLTLLNTENQTKLFYREHETVLKSSIKVTLQINK